MNSLGFVVSNCFEIVCTLLGRSFTCDDDRIVHDVQALHPAFLNNCDWTGRIMKLGRLPWARVSDAEYIASLRSQIGFWGHLRPWWILLNLGMLAAWIWVTRDAVGLIVGMVNPPQWAVLGFETGAMVGLFVGFAFHEIFRSLIFAIGNFRSERLLIHYYDAFNEECAVPDDGENANGAIQVVD